MNKKWKKLSCKGFICWTEQVFLVHVQKGETYGI